MRWICFIPLVIPAFGAATAGRFPIRFEPSSNGGYVVRARTGASYVTQSGDLRLTPQVEMQVDGGSHSVRSVASGRLLGTTNDLRGADPAKWRTGIPQYGNVRFASVWRGIDLVYHGDETNLEYDFVVGPKASPDRIVLTFRGAESVHINSEGDLMVRSAGDEICFHAPRILQDGKPIAGGYRLLGGNRVGFRLGAYDRNREMVIDPVLGYAALFGTNGSDPIQSVAVDATGNVYVAGTTLTEIPLMNPINGKQGAGNCSPEPGKMFSQCEDAFVAKFDATGTQLLYSTYLGGDGRDFAAGITVDHAGNAYVAGYTRPAGFLAAGEQAWVMKLNPTGSALLYNRNIGGMTTASGVAVDSQGDAYVAGTSFADFPAVNAFEAHAPASSLLVTHDGGATWRSLNNNLGSVTVNSLAIDPTQTSTLYAATSSGLYKSVDAGASWTQVFTAAKVANMVVVDPKTPSTLYVLYADSPGSGTGIAKSVDAGTTWQVLTTALPAPKLPAPVRQFGGLSADPSNPSTLWLTDTAIGSPEIYQSLDGGVHWSDVHDFPVSFIPGHGDSLAGGAILVDPANSSRVYVCCGSQLTPVTPALFRTDDGGKTWAEGGRAAIATYVVDPRNGATLYAASGGGLLRSKDEGQTWAAVTLPSVGVPGASFRGPLIDPSGGIYLLNDAGILLRSKDDGATWTTSNGPWSNAATGQGVQLLAIDPVNPSSTIYVGFASAGSSEHAFTTKLDSSGSIIWSTLIGGSQTDEALAIATDSGGNAMSPAGPILWISLSRMPFRAFGPRLGVTGSTRLSQSYRVMAVSCSTRRTLAGSVTIRRKRSQWIPRGMRGSQAPPV